MQMYVNLSFGGSGGFQIKVQKIWSALFLFAFLPWDPRVNNSILTYMYINSIRFSNFFVEVNISHLRMNKESKFVASLFAILFFKN